MSADKHASLDVEKFRKYLLLLAHIHLDHRLRSKVAPSDIVQQTLIQAHERREQFRGRTVEEKAAWLRAILVNHVARLTRDFRREKRDVTRERSLEDALGASSARLDLLAAKGGFSPSQQLMREEFSLKVADAIMSLPEAQREVILGHYVRGLPIARLAQIQDRTVPAVAGLIRRALERLREILREAE